MTFTRNTFELLNQLKQNNEFSFFREHKQQFNKDLINPFRELIINGVIPLLSEDLKKSINTKKRIFGQIHKNDFGRGGVNPFYWSAFTPNRSTRKQEDVQLLVFINHEFLEFGFFPGWHTNEDKILQLMENYETILQSKDFDSFTLMMEDLLPARKLVYREDTYLGQNFKTNNDGFIVSKNYIIDWKLYFNESMPEKDSPMIVIPKEIVINTSFHNLSTLIANTFNSLFPLIQLATTQDPNLMIGNLVLKS